MSRTFDPISWVVPGILPEGFTLLVGQPKIGKSWMALNYAIAVALGETVFGKIDVAQGDVLYLALEDTQRRLQSRLNCCCSTDVPNRLFLFTDWARMDSGGLEDINDWLDAYPQARLVVIDTVAKLWPVSTKFDPGRTMYHHDYDSICAIKRVADERKVAIIGVHHPNKRESNEPLEKLSGTNGVAGASDTIHILTRSRNSDQAELLITGRDVEEQTLAFHFDSSHGIWLLAEKNRWSGLTPERLEVLRVMEDHGREISPADVAKALHKDSGAARSLMMKLEQDGHITRAAYGKYIITDNSSNTSEDGVDTLVDHPAFLGGNSDSVATVDASLPDVSDHSEEETSMRPTRKVPPSGIFH